MGPTKNDSSLRTVEVPPEVMAKLWEWRSFLDDEFKKGGVVDPSLQVCARPDGGRLPHRAVQSGFKKLLKTAGLPHMRFHDLRHTHATALLRDRVGVHIVARRLGHTHVTETLDTYAHIIPGDDHEACVSIGKPFR